MDLKWLFLQGGVRIGLKLLNRGGCAVKGTAVRLKNTKKHLTVGENVEFWEKEYTVVYFL